MHHLGDHLCVSRFESVREPRPGLLESARRATRDVVRRARCSRRVGLRLRRRKWGADRAARPGDDRVMLRFGGMLVVDPQGHPPGRASYESRIPYQRSSPPAMAHPNSITSPSAIPSGTSHPWRSRDRATTPSRFQPSGFGRRARSRPSRCLRSTRPASRSQPRGLRSGADRSSLS